MMTHSLKNSSNNLLKPIYTGIAFLVALFAAQTAFAQSAVIDSGEEGADPVEIEATEGIEWVQKPDETFGYYKAIGNARARQGAINIRANELIAHYNEAADGGQDMHRIDAEGGVVVNQNQTNAYGDRGAYHTAQQVAVLVGRDLRLVDPQAKITADDSLEFWNERNVAVARGNAVLVTEDKVMKAGVMTAFISRNEKTDNNEVNRVDATSGVHISTATDIIIGEEGVYDLVKEIATLCGDVKITRGRNQLNGECAEVNMKTGRSRLLSSGGRVSGLISNSATGPAPQ